MEPLPIYDANGKITGYREAGETPGQQADADFGFEAYLAKMLTEAGGLTMSGSDSHAGWVFGKGPHKGKSKEQVMQLAREQWKSLGPQERQSFVDMGNNRDIRGGTGLPLEQSGPNGQTEKVRFGGQAPDASPGSSGITKGASANVNQRYNRMGQEQQNQVQGARNAAQQVANFYANNPAAAVDRQTEARNAELAKSGITDMGGGQKIMNNKYGSGFAKPATPGAKREPGKIFDEHGQVDLSGKGATLPITNPKTGAVTPSATTYKTDASGNIAMRPTTQEAVAGIQQQQQIIAGAGLPLAQPGVMMSGVTPENRLAADRQNAITQAVQQGAEKKLASNVKTAGATAVASAASTMGRKVGEAQQVAGMQPAPAVSTVRPPLVGAVNPRTPAPAAAPAAAPIVPGTGVTQRLMDSLTPKPKTTAAARPPLPMTALQPAFI